MNKWYIYKHTNKINRKVYIGQSCQDPKKRWGNGTSQYKHNQHFLNAIKKYGWNNFEHEILIDDLSEQEMQFWEQYYIIYYDAQNPEKGYNINKGGERSPFKQLWKNADFRTKQSNRQSQFMKQRMKNKQVREHLSQIAKIYWQDQTKREQQSKRMTETLNKLWKDEQYIQKQSNRMKQYIQNHKQEHVVQCKENAYKNWQNPEYRKKICKSIRNLETGLIFQSAAAAARWCGLADRSSITKHLTQHTKSAGKHPETKVPLHWQYVEESEVI